MFQQPKIELNVKELGAALMWLRNHFEYYDVSEKVERKLTERILNAVDIILLSKDEVNSWVTETDMRHFKKKFLDK